MEEKDIALIDRYFRNALTGEERATVEFRLAHELEFREAVELHGDALEAIRMEGSAMLRKRLTEKGRAMDAEAKKKPGLWRWFGLLALLLAVAVWWRMATDIPAEQPVNQPSPTPPGTATPPPAALPTVPEKPEKQAPAKPGNQAVFAAWFQPYKDESLEPSRRGNNEPSPVEQFQQLYWDGNYPGALAAFDALGTTMQNNDNLLFLKANCLLAGNRAEEAVVLLETILHNDRSRFMAQAKWYLALGRLQTGRRKQAEVLLRQIAADPDSPRRADAQRVLRDF